MASRRRYIAAAEEISGRLLPAVSGLTEALRAKQEAFAGITKCGRTHLMDATPLTLGQEFSAYVSQLEFGARGVRQSLDGLMELAIGGTAVGTGLNTFPEFGDNVAAAVSEKTGLPFVSSANKFAALAANDPLVAASGSLKTLAVALMKIGNDIRLLASGPRCGLGEIRQVVSQQPRVPPRMLE